MSVLESKVMCETVRKQESLPVLESKVMYGIVQNKTCQLLCVKQSEQILIIGYVWNSRVIIESYVMCETAEK